MHRLSTVAAGLAAALLMPAAPAMAEEPAVCHVAYQTTGNSSAFDGRIDITNTGSVTLYGWTLKFSLPAGQTFRSGRFAIFTVEGQDVTGRSLPYNSEVDPGESVRVRFNASGSAQGPRPAEFKINEYVCTTD